MPTERKVYGYILPSELYARVMQNQLSQPAGSVYQNLKDLEACEVVYEKEIQVPDAPPGDGDDTKH